MSTWHYSTSLEDEHRSAIGDGSLDPSRFEPSDFPETIGANGSILQIQVSDPEAATGASGSTS